MKVIGIDPGLRVTGYAVLGLEAREERIFDAGVFRADAQKPLAERLGQLFADMAGLLEEYRPDYLAVEELYSHYQHPQTAILMGHARGVFLLAAARQKVPVTGFSATRVKKSLTGNGRASKEQMQRAITTQLRLAEPPKPADVADAMALALCCLHEQARGGLAEVPARVRGRKIIRMSDLPEHLRELDLRIGKSRARCPRHGEI